MKRKYSSYSYRRRSNFKRRRFNSTSPRLYNKRGGFFTKNYKATIEPRIGTNLSRRQRTVYRYPFSFSTTVPKIPDGRCVASLGLRHQCAKEYSVDVTAGVLGLCLVPGVQLTSIAVTPVTGNPYTQEYQFFDDHVKFTKGSTDADIAVSPILSLTDWRLVSSAIRFTLVNNADENDGWFESVRVSMRDTYKYLKIYREAAEDTERKIGFSNDFCETLMTNNICANPSYSSGKLRDIHKYIFQLKPNGADHEMRSIKELYPGAVIPPGEGVNQFAMASTSMSQSFVDNVFDPSFDMLLIKVHGRKGAETLNNTRLMAHVVSNIETIYTPDSSYAKFHSETVKDPYFDKIKSYLVADVRSATPRPQIR